MRDAGSWMLVICCASYQYLVSGIYYPVSSIKHPPINRNFSDKFGIPIVFLPPEISSL